MILFLRLGLCASHERSENMYETQISSANGQRINKFARFIIIFFALVECGVMLWTNVTANHLTTLTNRKQIIFFLLLHPFECHYFLPDRIGLDAFADRRVSKLCAFSFLIAFRFFWFRIKMQNRNFVSLNNMRAVGRLWWSMGMGVCCGCGGGECSKRNLFFFFCFFFVQRVIPIHSISKLGIVYFSLLFLFVFMTKWVIVKRFVWLQQHHQSTDSQIIAA